MERIDWSVCVCVCDQWVVVMLSCIVLLIVFNAMGGRGGIYDSFLKLVIEFSQLNSLPIELSFQDDVTAQILMQNKANWYKACHSTFGRSKLSKIIKLKKRSHKPAGSSEKKVNA